MLSSKGQKILFWGDIIHAQRVQCSIPRSPRIFDIDQTAAAGNAGNQLLARARKKENVLIAAPHRQLFLLPRVACARTGSGYSWVPGGIYAIDGTENAPSPQK